MATRINMAANSFTRYFKRQLNISPQAYIRKLRLDKACELLDHTLMSIEEISEAAGFSDRFHFSKAFKKLKGITPVEYRKRHVLVGQFV
ncbi:MAG: helix-turn-helix domain-containing protein [Bacteroidales bacterium]|nr:helix-turn-helix domain-containing protein [Bacteroidales bacterium]